MKKYIPIFVLLKDGLERVYNDLNLNEVFDRIIAPDNNSNEKAFNRNILLLLDGLDEYHDNDADQEKNLSDNSKDIKMLMEKIENDFTKYRNLKVIITARLQHDLPSKLPMVMGKGKEYLRLLPFTEQQVEEFFDRSRDRQYRAPGPPHGRLCSHHPERMVDHRRDGSHRRRGHLRPLRPPGAAVRGESGGSHHHRPRTSPETRSRTSTRRRAALRSTSRPRPRSRRAPRWPPPRSSWCPTSTR